MHAVSTNQIADILHYNGKYIYIYVQNVVLNKFYIFFWQVSQLLDILKLIKCNKNSKEQEYKLIACAI